MTKSVLVLEELGIPRQEFEKLASVLSYEIVWFDSQVIFPDNIEGIITIKTKVNSDVFKTFFNVKFVAVAFTGYDCVDIEACEARNIKVFNVPGYSTDSVAELAVALTISLYREIPKADFIVRNGGWQLESPGIEISGKTVGILGTGTIGTKAAQIFKAIGCNIIGYSRSVRSKFEEYGEYVSSLDELLEKADIVSVHLPLNHETKGYITEEELKKMKKTAVLINTARGPVVKEQDLIHTLKEKRIFGAAIDVFDVEPINTDNELLSLKNTVITPHLAYKTHEALIRRAQITINNILGFGSGQVQNKVN
jgi:lactate dehydrogenase-like 2-hydroxyacid dehydrogenase